MAARTAPDPATSPWLAIAAPVGRVATAFLLVANFALLFAPLFFLMDLQSSVDPNGTGGPLLYLFTDPVRLIAISDLVAILGTVLLACAIVLVLLGLLRGDRRVPLDAFLWGFACLACLVAWVPVMAYAGAQASGAAGSVDAVAATGGWGVASVLLLGAAVAYLLFTRRIEDGARPRRLTSLRWPLYAAVNVLGSAAIAGFFGGLAAGSASLEAFSLGLALKVTLVPILGIMAYRDLRDRFPLWSGVAIIGPRRATGITEIARGRRLPIPPPPDD